MPGLNRVQLIGYLGRDPETRYTPRGNNVCSYPVAVTRRWRSGDGESREATDWFTVEAWGRLGEICQEYLGKGRLVFVEGRLRTDRYEVEGETRYFTRVIASQMQMLDRPEDGGETMEEPAEAAAEEEEEEAEGEPAEEIVEEIEEESGEALFEEEPTEDNGEEG